MQGASLHEQIQQRIVKLAIRDVLTQSFLALFSATQAKKVGVVMFLERDQHNRSHHLKQI
jgi:hypothetical protein